jgi:hypothetical protein
MLLLKYPIVHAFVKILHYTIHYANHPDGTAHALSTIINKSILKHYELDPFITDKIQGTFLELGALYRPSEIAALYSPPRHRASAEEYGRNLSQLRTHYVVAGGWIVRNTA